MKGRLLKATLTVLGAIVLSTIGIFAADSLQGVDHDLSNLAGTKGAGICQSGSVPMKSGSGVVCVDMYEASPSTKCPHSNPANTLESEQNANSAGCYAASVPSAIPWSFISLPQAQRMCAGAGKRLPKSSEWYAIALGSDPNNCVIRATAPQQTGTEACKSAIGAFDLVGNVWEWVDETVTGNTFEGRAVPEEGYVTSVDASGIAITSGSDPDQLYGNDYFWSKTEGVFGMIRGGFYGSNSDAGLYSVNASVPTSFASQGVGFRCVADVL